MDEEEEAMKRYKLKSNGSWIFYFIGVRTFVYGEVASPNVRITAAQLITIAAWTDGPPLPFFFF